MCRPEDIKYMKRALALARKGMGKTSPNPMVGAVVVKKGNVLGEGYHAYYGGPHAESVALAGLTKQQTIGASLYVNLEPCCHYGKTPPCSEPILCSGIARIIIGMVDPNPVVNGRSIREFSKRGIEVVPGVLEQECRELNRGYLKHIATGLPWVTVKIAQTLDGRIADSAGRSRWITGELSRKAVHRLRASHDAALIGIGTVKIDNPEMTVRLTKGHQPQRIVLDPHLEIPLNSTMLQDQTANPIWIITSESANSVRKNILTSMGAKIFALADERQPFAWEHILRLLGNNGILSLLIEGGRTVFTGLLKEKMADRIIISMAPKLLGSTGFPAVCDLGISALDAAYRYRIITQHRLGNDLWVELAPDMEIVN
jgi:diaminohydroxyphosphoribosylaminopyrimidine deaminase/5-amino-6-(5-phosphoribosylamino)uracil reductase